MVETKSLTKNVISGSFWIAAFEISNQILQFLKTFYAAKLLSPADFGIFGVAFLIIGFLEIISTTGMKEAVIQRKDDKPEYLNTVWTVEVLKGCVVFIACLIAAPFIGTSIAGANQELTTQVVRFIGAVYFLQCATNIGVVFFERDINFRKFFYYQFAGTVVDVAASVFLVHYTHSITGLFYGVVAGATTKVLVSFLISSYKPSLRFYRDKARELYQYGRWIFSSRVFNFIGLQADSIITSSFFNLHALGLYQMSLRIGNLPMSQMSNVIGRLAFPTFSKVHEEREKLKEVFLTFANVLTLIIVPVVVLIVGLIEEFTLLFLGEKWIDIAPLVKILVLSGLLRIYVSLIDSLFCATGHPRYSSRMQLVRFVIFMLSVFPLGYYMGLTGIALSGLISLVVVFFYFMGIANKYVSLDKRTLLDDLVLPLLLGCAMTGGLILIKYFFAVDSMLKFAIAVITLLASYVILALLINKFTPARILARANSLLHTYKDKT